MGHKKITNYSANMHGIAVKQKPIANTKRDEQKGGEGQKK